MAQDIDKVSKTIFKLRRKKMLEALQRELWRRRLAPAPQANDPAA